jgi:Domain of unknown function (DUF4249)
MKRKFLVVLVFFFLASVWSCKKVIQVDLNSAAPQIVIEGEITDATAPYYVQITKTVNFSASNSFPPVSGATVQISDSNTAQSYTMLESNPGVYTTSALHGQPTHTYLLSVMIGSQSYTASSTMPAKVPFDSISFVENFDLNNKRGIDAVVNFQDPPGLGNDYRFVETVNGRQLPDIFVFEDRLSNGKYIQQTLYNDTSTLHVGDALKVDMYCVDKSIYNYFFGLFQVRRNGGFQSASPANPNSNISNGALGYFSAHTVSSKDLTVY